MKGTRSTIVMLCALAAAVAARVAVAQTTQVEDRYTFSVANSPAAPSGESRLELVVNKWSTDVERDRILSAVKEKGPDKVAEAISREYAVGYLHWPGNLNYALRYAHRVSRPDGGQDVILGVDRPISLWWSPSAQTTSQPVVIQLRVNKEGKGEGKLSSKVAADATAKTIVADDFATAPSVLLDVQRERGASSSS
jgi:hypothetical protein